MFGLKDTTELLPTHIHQFKGRLWAKKRIRKDSAGQQKQISAGFVYSTMIRLKAYIKRLSERNYLEWLRASDIPLNKIILQEPVYLTKAEMWAVIDCLDKWIVEVEATKYKRDWKYPAYMGRALVRMLYTTWLRNAEIRNLKLRDIDFERMTGVILWKGNKHGFFTFNEKAKEVLMIYLQKRREYYPNRRFTYLFSSANKDKGKCITGTGVNTLLMLIGKKAGVDKKLHAHVFRHTCATHLLDSGANIREVQEKLRHANLDTTALYTHVSNNKLTEITKGLWS